MTAFLKLTIMIVVLSYLTACDPAALEQDTANSKFEWTAQSQQGLYQATVKPVEAQIPIGQFHQWTITVKNANNQAVESARIVMRGGMPSHGHGLPTQPQVTEHLGDGEFKIEGVQFNMSGAWSLDFRIESAQGVDQVNFELELKP